MKRERYQRNLMEGSYIPTDKSLWMHKCVDVLYRYIPILNTQIYELRFEAKLYDTNSVFFRQWDENNQHKKDRTHFQNPLSLTTPSNSKSKSSHRTWERCLELNFDNSDTIIATYKSDRGGGGLLHQIDTKLSQMC